jgi:glycosyltransferase involved in cell wall biosynthesis
MRALTSLEGDGIQASLQGQQHGSEPLATTTLAAAVVIPTRNRKDCLKMALDAVLAQTVRAEIIVLDDDSDDGTEEMVRQGYSSVRYQRFSGPSGPSLLRNRGTEMAGAPIIFAIDDDAIMVSPRTIEQTLAEFDHPRVAAVGIPFINVRQNNVINQRAPDADGVWICEAYVGASHALRREVFLAAGGYREELFYMGEEGDLCVRLLDRGYVVRLGRADPIHHLESPNRSSRRADLYGRRNDILSVWQNVPMPYMPLHLAGKTIHGIQLGFRCGRRMVMVEGLARGYGSILRRFFSRRPVKRETQVLSRLLRTRVAVRLDEIESRLPRLQSVLA